MSYTDTLRTLLKKAVPNTNQQFETAVHNANLDRIDELIGAFRCTSGTRPSAPFNGMIIYETDTGRTLVRNGGVWLPIGAQSGEYLNTGVDVATQVINSTTYASVTNPTLAYQVPASGRIATFWKYTVWVDTPMRVWLCPSPTAPVNPADDIHATQHQFSNSGSGFATSAYGGPYITNDVAGSNRVMQLQIRGSVAGNINITNKRLTVHLL